MRRAQTRKGAALVGTAAVAVAGGAAFLTSNASVASAASFSVTNCNDSGSGSFRQAILDANAAAGADTISISATCTASSPVNVASRIDVVSGGGDLTISGPGASSFVLDGGDAVQIFSVLSADNLSISGVTFQNGSSTTVGTDGGAVYIQSANDVLISGVVFESNDAGSFHAGALQVGNSANVTITDSTFSNNSGGIGGALYLVYNSGPTVISNSTFVGNTATDYGGALVVYEEPASFSMFNCTLTGNSAGGNGGAIAFSGMYTSAVLGFNTITDNTAGGNGGGLYSLYGDSAETITIFGSIFAGNTAANGDEAWIDASVPVTSSDSLFRGGVVGFTPGGTDLVGVDPVLGPLADNGGLTMTRALLIGSPALDAGPTTFAPFVGDGFDQRGTPFVRSFNGRSDIGAFERGPDPVPPSTTTTPTTTPGGDPVTPKFTG